MGRSILELLFRPYSRWDEIFVRFYSGAFLMGENIMPKDGKVVVKLKPLTYSEIDAIVRDAEGLRAQYIQDFFTRVRRFFRSVIRGDWV